MTMRAATVEIVAETPRNLFDVEADVRQLVQLQREAAEIERRAKVLRSEVKSFLLSHSLTSYQSSDGHRASLIESNAWHADREAAQAVLSPETFTTIFKSTTSVSLRVK
jgi:hypothetical protein